jgi:hypothetical protein
MNLKQLSASGSYSLHEGKDGRKEVASCGVRQTSVPTCFSLQITGKLQFSKYIQFY